MGSLRAVNSRGSWPRKPWHQLPDDALLAIPIGRLDLKFDETPLVAFERRLRRELDLAGVKRFHPFVYLGDEWFSPVGIGAISVPFFLADPRLKKLAGSYFLDIEGGTSTSFMRLLRHEAGHAFEHAYELSERSDWKRFFGDANKPYRSHSFRADPSSTDFVRHLDRTYAQAHPTEDFAETFAIALTPGSDWRARYKNAPGALKKLNFVVDIISRLGEKPPRVREATLAFAAQRMRRTLGDFFSSRKDAPFMATRERALRAIFPESTESRARDFLKSQKKEILSLAQNGSPGAARLMRGEYDRMLMQSRSLNLGAPIDPHLAKLQLTAVLADSLPN